jgi:hypothetical protein
VLVHWENLSAGKGILPSLNTKLGAKKVPGFSLGSRVIPNRAVSINILKVTALTFAVKVHNKTNITAIYFMRFIIPC